MLLKEAMLKEAIDDQDVDALRYYLELESRDAVRADALDAAAANGFVDALELLLSRGARPTAGTVWEAARGGHLDALALLCEHGEPPDAAACEAAAYAGSLRCLAFLRRIGTPWTESSCWAAAERGHLEVLEYLHENGCPWDERACDAAASCGNLRCLEWLINKDCPRSESLCVVAARRGHLDCLKLLSVMDGGDGGKCDERACVAAARGGHLTCLAFLHSSGYLFSKGVFRAAVEHGEAEVLHYLLTLGCPCSTRHRVWATRRSARLYLWPRLRRFVRSVVGFCHYVRFVEVARGKSHGTAAASLARSLDLLRADALVGNLVS